MNQHTSVAAIHSVAPETRVLTRITPARAAAAGIAALAVAMGIGRFAFTPLLPLMQHDAGLGLAQGSWLAAANYVGYLVGALVCLARPRAGRRDIQFGLLAVAGSTLGMGLTAHVAVWLALRFTAGAASALVLVGVSAWAMPVLARSKNPVWPGRLFAGVGIGICAVGVLAVISGLFALSSQTLWIGLGTVAAIACGVIWRQIDDDRRAAAPAVERATSARLGRSAWIAAVCYGAFGYGYIIPATFLPAQARATIADPSVFGWVWPVFGIAAALSTVLASRLVLSQSPRRLWTQGQIVLAIGVIAPLFGSNLVVLLVSALCVGGTFMVITMAGIEEARRLAGVAAPRLIALFTAAFAAGQIAGPLTVAAFGGSIVQPSVIAAGALVVASLVLRLAPGEPIDQ